VGANTERVLAQAQAQGVLPREAALDLALRRLKQAMGYRRFFIF
jgi:glutamate dehydrogenase (NAD(P)+)